MIVTKLVVIAIVVAFFVFLLIGDYNVEFGSPDIEIDDDIDDI